MGRISDLTVAESKASHFREFGMPGVGRKSGAFRDYFHSS